MDDFIEWQMSSVKRRKVVDSAAQLLDVTSTDDGPHSTHAADDDVDDDLCSEMTDASQVKQHIR